METALKKEALQTLQNRANELKNIPEVKEKLLRFKTTEEADQWLFIQAIATLIIPKDKR